MSVDNPHPAEGRVINLGAERIDRSVALLRVAVVAVAAVNYLASVGISRGIGPLAPSILAGAALYSLWILLARPYARLAYKSFGGATFVVDVCLITLWCYATGGPSSEFWALYLIAVISVALRYDLLEIVGAALGIAAVYVAVMAVEGGLPTTSLVFRPAVIVLTGMAVGLLARQRRAGQEERSALKRLADRSSAALERQERLVERLREVDDAKSEFVAVASHEFRTPLAGIIGVLNTIRTHGEGMDPGLKDELLEGAATQASRLARLVDDLLTVSRIENGGLALNMADVDVEGMVREAVKASGTEAVAEVRVTGVGTVRCDRDRIVRVLANLLDNAKKYSPAEAAVQIMVDGEPGRVRFSVRDHGPGVPAAEHQHVFDRFSRLRSSQGSGAGLGLYIARTLIEAHGGTIGVENVDDGGARFWFTIPEAMADPQLDLTEPSSAAVS